jgi:hypothetical protein
MKQHFIASLSAVNKVSCDNYSGASDRGQGFHQLNLSVQPSVDCNFLVFSIHTNPQAKTENNHPGCLISPLLWKRSCHRRSQQDSDPREQWIQVCLRSISIATHGTGRRDSGNKVETVPVKSVSGRACCKTWSKALGKQGQRT